MSKHYGAQPSDWGHFSLVLGLTEDLLPVVSKPDAVISPMSAMKGLGKTPSKYNRSHQAVGIGAWTGHISTQGEIASWQKQPDYGICIQTRGIRALDIDVEDEDEADDITTTIHNVLKEALPRRVRNNSNKKLFVLDLQGEYTKRAFKTKHGLVEFLATGQQFIAIGTHTSGSRYEWAGGLPSEIPVVTPEQFEELWATLVSKFAIEEPTTSKQASKGQKIHELHTEDPISQRLVDQGFVLAVDTKTGRLDITCPFAEGHSSEPAVSSTSYYPPNTGGYKLGHFKCLHASCNGRLDSDFTTALGFSAADDFDDISGEPGEVLLIGETNDPNRFKLVPAAEFAKTTTPAWIIKGVLPQAEVAVMFGDSGSGKSFMALDLAGAIAQGIDWNGRKTKQGKIVYIAAEGAGGCRKRVRAYADTHEVELEDLDIYFISGVPNFMEKKDIADIIAAMSLQEDIRVIIVDTWAQVTGGANENSGEDMGLALKNCRKLHQKTGALVLLIHHSGKNAAAGARGWSGLRAAADTELEVLRADDDRVITVTKQKDGEDGLEIGFKLAVHSIGVDEDGELVTSCSIEFTDTTRSEIRDKAKGKPNAGKAESAFLDIISRMSQEQGQLPWMEDLRRVVGTELPGSLKNFKRIMDNLIFKGLVTVDAQERLSLPLSMDLI